MGYLRDQEKTVQAFDSEGYFHSGDICEFDSSTPPAVFLKVTGRIKDLLITDGGENISPGPIESEIKTMLPAVSNCMVVGDRCKYLAVLITLKVQFDNAGQPLELLDGEAFRIGKELGSNATTVTEVKADPLWKNYIDDGLKLVNVKAPSRAHFVQKWALLLTDFSEAGGELTSTLKVKRSAVVEKYADIIGDLYSDRT